MSISQVDQSTQYISLRIVDFAGQSIYYNTHSVFMRDTAVYLLVHRSNTSPKDEAREYFCQGGDETEVDAAGVMQCNLSYLKQWMDAVHSTRCGQSSEQEALTFKGK